MTHILYFYMHTVPSAGSSQVVQRSILVSKLLMTSERADFLIVRQILDLVCCSIHLAFYLPP